jgi:hypothetical protein
MLGSWSKNAANPILSSSGSGWDGDDIIGSGLALRNGTYQVLYTGGSGDPGTLQIGHASGSSLDNLSKDGDNPVIPASANGWDSNWTLDPSEPYWDGSQWHCLYAGGDGSTYAVGHATNPNSDMSGQWSKDSANPVIEPADLGSWADSLTWDPSVEVDGSTKHLYFTAEDSSTGERKIGYATSQDWTSWSLSASNPIVTAGDVDYADNSSGGVTAPTSWTDGDGYHHLWFDADPGTGEQDICHMSSTSRTSPTDDPDNPVLRKGGGGKWDSTDVADPSVIEDGLDLRMLYTGYNGSRHAVGVANIEKDQPTQL